jgi:hypothetical protein
MLAITLRGENGCAYVGRQTVNPQTERLAVTRPGAAAPRPVYHQSTREKSSQVVTPNRSTPESRARDRAALLAVNFFMADMHAGTGLFSGCCSLATAEPRGYQRHRRPRRYRRAGGDHPGRCVDRCR